MICPNCGKVQDPPVPEKSYDMEVLGECEACQTNVYAAGTSRFNESSVQSTVRTGHAREEDLMEVLLDHEPGDYHDNRGDYAKIDREVYDEDGNLLYFAEVRERTCTLNGYRETKFPYSKIDTAETLLHDYDVPVHIYIVFRDAWTRLPIKKDEEYQKGDEPFAPNYRPWQEDMDSQVPVMYPVEELEVLEWGHQKG